MPAAGQPLGWDTPRQAYSPQSYRRLALQKEAEAAAASFSISVNACGKAAAGYPESPRPSAPLPRSRAWNNTPSAVAVPRSQRVVSRADGSGGNSLCIPSATRITRFIAFSTRGPPQEVLGGAGTPAEGRRRVTVNGVPERPSQLLSVLNDLRYLLRRQGEDFYADWIDSDAEKIERGDYEGVRHFLSAYGGMGSLNDVYFHPLNGNAASDEEGWQLTLRFER